MNYYNENDKFAASWLRELIKAGHISPGEVDERSIEDVQPNDVKGYKQCHWFGGIGGWSYALRLAGVSDDYECWTGSCPCQPFSSAGKRSGTADERHLWPAWFHLIEQCRPPIVIGEQVEAAVRHVWLDLVQDDLEGIGYAVGAAGLPAAGVGAPHIRQRLWFVAESNEYKRRQVGEDAGGCREGSGAERLEQRFVYGGNGIVAHTPDLRRLERRGAETAEIQRKRAERGGEHTRSGEDGQLSRGSEGLCWTDCDWLPCIDGKSRPTQPGLQPLAHGVSNRVGKLRGYGNAIVPQVAEAFIRAYLEG